MFNGFLKCLGISSSDVYKLGESKGLKEVCSYNISCRDSQEEAKQEYILTIVGKDSSSKIKKLIFVVTEWEEIVEEDGDNKT